MGSPVDVIVPYTHVCSETWQAVPYAEFIPVKGENGYRSILAERWARGETFVLVEHDVAPTREQVEALAACSEPWCCYGYGPGYWLPTFGCVKFGAELIAGTKDVWDNEWPWDELDQRFWTFAQGSRGFHPHLHWPSVRHVATGDREEPTIEQMATLVSIEMQRLRFAVDGTLPSDEFSETILTVVPAQFFEVD